MQIQANVLGVPVVRSRISETTALGVAYLAGLATGYWSSAEELTAQWQEERRFLPQWQESQRQAHVARWREAVSRSRAWAQS
jgi:glycerol kinase